jgi:asparaginyl-tRNA synthetase
MLEAEVAFVESLDGLMDTVEQGIKRVLRGVLHASSSRGQRARRDLEVIQKSLTEEVLESSGVDDEPECVERVEMLKSFSGNEPFARISYTRAVEILRERHSRVPFVFEPGWGAGLQSEHEKYLAGEVFGGPVFVTDYPRNLKPFYMRLNEADPNLSTACDQQTVACFDLLAPGIGELAGGSLREERLAQLVNSMDLAGMKKEDYDWYLDLRRYGTVKHGGWGMGFERFICWITGVGNVRDVVAFPRWKGHCRY